MSDAIEMRVRLWSLFVPQEGFARCQLKVGDSCGQAVVSHVWILGSRGSMARVDGGDPGDED
jgi:hypothetical protein